MKFKFTSISSNVKTGPIPVTMTERDSCPDTCLLKRNGCYADNFPLSLHWDRVETNGISFDALLENIKALPDGQLWRHNVAGDLPSLAGLVDSNDFNQLVDAAKHTSPIIYTHHRLYPHNQKLFSAARSKGVVVNASCESIGTAYSAIRSGVNAVCIMPKDAEPVTKLTHPDSGEELARVVICPAQQRDSVTCASCGLCARDRVESKVIVGFIPHGAKSKKVNAMVAA